MDHADLNMPAPVIQPSFAAGELTPSLYGRVDLAKYQVGARTLLNWFVRPYGSVATRAGTEFVGEVYDSSKQSRLHGFQFSSVQTYVLEWGDLKLRIIKEGGYVLDTSTAITGISRANPGVVTAVAHGLTTGDHVWISGVSGMTQVNRRRFTATVLTADTFSIGIDTSAYTAWSSGGTVERFYTVTTPYALADLPLLKFVQSADTLTITHPSYAPRKLTRTGHASWTLTTKSFQPDQADPTGFTTTAVGMNFLYGITAENDVTGEESRALQGWSNTETSTLTWTAAAGATNYNIYKNRNGIFGFIGRATQPSGFTDATIQPDITSTPPQAKNPFASSSNYPGCSTYHDGRQWYGRTDTNPQGLWATQSASFNNMDTTPSGTQDSDAITRTIASSQVDEIRHLTSLNQLLVFTSGAVWKAWSGLNSDVITPANCNVKLQNYDGSSHVEPIKTATSVLYVTTSGRRVRDLLYDSGSETFQGKDLSILSAHIFEGKTITERAYARDPDGLVWFVLDDGTMACLTYLREHDVTAWSRADTDGTIESVAAVQENNETILYMQVARTVGGATKRYVERMPSRYFETVYDAWCVDCGYRYDGWNTTSTKTLAISGATYAQGDTVTLTAAGHTPFTSASVGNQYILRSGQNQVTVTVTGYTSSTVVSATLDIAPHTSLQATAVSDWALAITTLTGLWHLEGLTVAVLADGSVFDDAVVTNGTITINRASGRVLAGLSYNCDFETLDIEQQPTLQGRQKRVSEVVMRVRSSRGLAVGPTSDRLDDIKERTTETMGYPTTLTTGDERITIDPSWNSNGRIFVRQAYPLPSEILAVIPRLDAGE